MPKCDICGCRGSLNDLIEIYRTPEIQSICSDCEKIVNKHLNKIQNSHGQAQRSLLKRFMGIMKGSVS